MILPLSVWPRRRGHRDLSFGVQPRQRRHALPLRPWLEWRAVVTWRPMAMPSLGKSQGGVKEPLEPLENGGFLMV
jgi:hypothetical protein